MLTRITGWLCATFLAFPVWAEPEKLPKTVSEAYHLMTNAVTEYDGRATITLPYSDPAYGQYFDWHDDPSSLYGLPVIEDPWHGSVSASAGDTNTMLAILSCETIGQPTLTYLRGYFAGKDRENFTKTEGRQWRLINYFAEVPKEAASMQVCELFYGLHISATKGWEYESLLATIGDNFSATKSVDRQQEQPKEGYSFKGVGNLDLNGAVVIAFKAILIGKPTDGEHVPMWMASVSYRLASPPPS